MRKSKRTNLILVLSIVLFICVGYAVLTSDLNITGLFNFTSNTWSVYLDNIVLNEYSSSSSLPTINNDKDTLTFSATLNKPFDYYEFNVDVVNDSTLDIMYNSTISISYK